MTTLQLHHYLYSAASLFSSRRFTCLKCRRVAQDIQKVRCNEDVSDANSGLLEVRRRVAPPKGDEASSFEGQGATAKENPIRRAESRIYNIF